MGVEASTWEPNTTATAPSSGTVWGCWSCHNVDWIGKGGKLGLGEGARSCLWEESTLMDVYYVERYISSICFISFIVLFLLLFHPASWTHNLTVLPSHNSTFVYTNDSATQISLQPWEWASVTSVLSLDLQWTEGQSDLVLCEFTTSWLANGAYLVGKDSGYLMVRTSDRGLILKYHELKDSRSRVSVHFQATRVFQTRLVFSEQYRHKMR